MADDKIVIQIQLDDGTVKEGFLNIQKQADKSAKAIGDAYEKETTSLTKLIAGSAIGNIIANTITSAFSKAFGSIRDLVSDGIGNAIATDNAFNKLNSSLALVGRYSQETSQELANFANELQATQNIGDDAALSLLSYATNFTKTTDQTKLATQAAIDFAAATGEDVNSSLKGIVGTLSGSTGLLTKLVPELKTLTKEQLLAGDAIDVIAKKFEGFAGQQVNTFDGAIKRLSLTFEDLTKSFGFIVTRSPALIAAFNAVSNIIQKIISGLDFQGKDPLKPILESAVQLLGVLSSLIAAVESVTSSIMTVVKVFVTGISAIGTGIQGAAALINESLASIGIVSQETADKSGKAFDESFKRLQNNANSTADSFKNIFNQDFATGLQNQLLIVNDAVVGASGTLLEFKNQSETTFDPLAEKLKAFNEGLISTKETLIAQLPELAGQINQFFGSISTDSVKTTQDLANLNQKVTAFSSNITATSAAISSAFKNGVQTAVVSGISRIGASLAQGSKAFDGFGKQVLGIIGDMAIQIGTTILAIGTAVDAMAKSLTTFFGGFAIVAGIALIAIGGLLKSLSGGSATAGTNAGATAGGGSGGADLSPTSDLNQLEQQKQQNAIAVNIQGDVLDSKDTSLRIVELIQQYGDLNGGNTVVS